MFTHGRLLTLLMVTFLFAFELGAQTMAQPESPASKGAEPGALNAARLVKFSGTLRDHAGAPLSGTVGVTLAIYKEQQGGTPLWIETQNVSLDAQGNYSLLLGATLSDGLPLDLFTTSESRWLGVQAQLPGELEQPRVLLVGVPYALKAADAETLGGKPLSAFVLAAPDATGAQATSTLDSGLRIVSQVAASVSGAAVSSPVTTSGGTQNKLPKWDATGTNLIDSAVFENGGNFGIGTTTPNFPLHVVTPTWDVAMFQGTDNAGYSQLELQGTGHRYQFGVGNAGETLFGVANKFYIYDGTVGAMRLALDTGGNLGLGTATPGFPLHIVTPNSDVAMFQGTTNTGYSQLEIQGTGRRYQFGVGNAGESFFGVANKFYIYDGTGGAMRLALDTAGNLGIGTATPGYKLDVQAGQINASGGLCIAGVCQSNWNSFSGSATFTAAPVGSGVNQGSLYVNPASASAGQTLIGAAVNGTQEFKVDSGGSVTTNGNINLTNNTNGAGTTGVITLAGNRFLHNFGTNNTFLGQNAGNFTMAGSANTATGAGALNANTTGNNNTATGHSAMVSNTTGCCNTAVGDVALSSNTTGNSNTAVGGSALQNNQTGCCNTAAGQAALNQNTTGASNTAMGGSALQNNQIGNNNTAVGQGALLNNKADLNTAVGQGALTANTSGTFNNAFGAPALAANTTGFRNNAFGRFALSFNTTGNENTAIGNFAGTTSNSANANVSGSDNVFIGFNAGPGTSTQLNNAAAIGTYATVSANNSMVLGSINGVNGATADTKVGIGTATPASRLDVESPNSDAGTFVTASTNGNAALQGIATGATGQNVGVIGQINTTTDNTAAVVGLATGASGLSAGVFGESGSPDGAGGVFSNSNAGGISLAATDQTTNNIVFTVRTSGNVGIGTTTPKTILEVASGDAYLSKVATGLILKSPDGTKCARISLDNTGALVTTALACP